jgi:hypothetical protein
MIRLDMPLTRSRNPGRRRAVADGYTLLDRADRAEGTPASHC